MSFSKNGSWDGPWGEAFTDIEVGDNGLLVAASFQGFTGLFRLSADDFKHAPPSDEYKAVSEAGNPGCMSKVMKSEEVEQVGGLGVCIIRELTGLGGDKGVITYYIDGKHIK
jgi:hypothetical protein